MSKKRIILGLFLLLNLTACQETKETNLNQSSNISTAIQKNIVNEENKVEIVYFHGNRRCYSCELLEQYSKETVEDFFKEQIEKNQVVFKSINVEKQENQEVVLKYQARWSSLFINHIKDGEDNINEEATAWRFLNDKEQFQNYLKNKIDNLL